MVQSVVCCTSDRAAHYVQRWIAEGKAFVCPRQSTQESGMLQLGLAFVDNDIKHRASVQVRTEDILRRASPHSLVHCLDLFGEKSALVLIVLADKLNAAGYPVYVFGSVAWEMIADVPYRTEQSDLDLLCDVSTMQDVRFVTSAFAAADRELPFRIDGELRFPNDACVNWREVVAALENDSAMEVLVKNEDGVCMSTLDRLLDVSYA